MFRRRSLRSVLSTGFDRRAFLFHVLRDTEGGEGGGSGEGGGATAKKPTTITTEDLTKKHGGAEAALMFAVGKLNEFHRDTFQQREEIRDLKSKLPPPGSRVLTPEQSASYDSYLALGSPEAVAKKVKERDEFESTVGQYSREKELRQAAKDAGGWDYDALARIVKDEQFVMVDAKDAKGNTVPGEDGNPKRVLHVKSSDDKTVPAEEHFKVFLPVLAPAKKEPETTPDRSFRRADGSPDANKEKLPTLFH